MRSNIVLEASDSKTIRISVDKDHYRRISVEDDVSVYHLYPTLSDWIGRQSPDEVNPRSHADDSLTGSVPKAIQQTIEESPTDFYLANRGETILAESVTFDPQKQVVEILLTDCYGDTAQQGVADGGTTDAVIARVQAGIAKEFEVESFSHLTQAQIPAYMKTARVHLEIIVGLKDRERISRLVQGRNTSRQVTSWSMADFKGHFEWIKKSLEDKKSEFKGRIGYEENASASVTVLDILAILTLFHPEYNEKGKAPTVAYSSKGRMDKRLVDEKTASGYAVLSEILPDILKLHDHVYSKFHEKYKESNPAGKLGRRGKTEDRIFPNGKKVLPLTGVESSHVIPSGVLFPLLASLRALVAFPAEKNEHAKAQWKADPFEFFDAHGAELVENLISQLENLQNNPQTMGKAKTVYTGLFDRASLLLLQP